MKDIQKIHVRLNLFAEQAEFMVARNLLVSLSCAETTKTHKRKKIRGGEKKRKPTNLQTKKKRGGKEKETGH